METFEGLVHWATAKGVQVAAVRPEMMPGRGSGMVATQDIEAGEIVVSVPTSTLRTLYNVPKTVSSKLPRDSSIHALLAASLAIDHTDESALWRAVFPTLASFEESMPIMWPTELQSLLPKPARNLLKKQQDKFQHDWDAFSIQFNKTSRDHYLHAWLLVNTRSFYYTTPKMNKYPHDDRLAMLPVADMFNHAESGCEATFSRQNYTIRAVHSYLKGEEVYFCYGAHSNDFLLAEYGFTLKSNDSDTVRLDDVIVPVFDNEQKDALNAKGFLGNYFLDSNSAVCFRTQVALRMLCCTRAQWEQFVDAQLDEHFRQREANILLLHLLGAYKAEIQVTLGRVDLLNVGEVCQRESLKDRWAQIEGIICQTMQSLSR